MITETILQIWLAIMITFIYLVMGNGVYLMYKKTHYAVSKLGRLIITLFFPFILICSGVGDL